MRKTIFFKRGLKTILAVWFLLCIFPGDCLFLGCVEKGLMYCDERGTVILSHDNVDSPIAMDDQHCPNCCAMCTHNLVVGLLQNSSLFFSSPSSRLKPLDFNHSKGILQTIIYHPPRLAS
jgi:hypothetical protein